MRTFTNQEKRPHWEGVGAAKGYPAEQMFLVMNARRHQSDTLRPQFTLRQDDKSTKCRGTGIDWEVK